MRDIDSDALSQVQRQLGISGIGSGRAVLEDDELRQVLDVGPAIRRGRADVANGGWFWGVLDNVHTGAEDLTSFINPYEADGFELTSFPPIVDVSRFDLWIISAFCEVLSGSGTIGTAQFFLGGPLRSLAFGKDDSAAAVTPVGGGFLLANWEVNVTDVTGNARAMQQDPDVGTWQKMGLRMPRGTNLVFASTSVSTQTLRLSILLGLFPIGLGQDIIV